MCCTGLSVFGCLFFTYSPLLHTLNDGDAPQQVSEQYVLWHNRF